MRYLIKIEYDGIIYKGWQKQQKLPTIQGKIEEKLKIYLKEEITIYAAGRTDTKVHAINQYAHFDYNKEIEENKFIYSINALLKEETIIIKKIKKVSKTFHARFSCTMKEYQYKLLISNHNSVFLNKRYWRIPKFNIELANKCAEMLIGTQDFSSFRDSQCQAESPIKTIKECNFKEKNNNIIIMKIKAKSFLHHQIRIIVGTILEIILKNKTELDFKEIINKKNRQKAGKTAPAQGLFLSKVHYNKIFNK